MYLLQNYIINQGSTSSTIKDLLPLITVTVTLILFIIDRILAFRIRKKEAKRNWYQNVLVEPNLEKISEFYLEIEQLFKDATRTLSDKQDLAHVELKNLQRQFNEKFTDLKRKLESHLVYPLHQQYGELTELVDGNFNDLYDNYTTALDKGSLNNEDIAVFINSLYGNKGKLLNLLYLPVSTTYHKAIKKAKKYSK